MTEYTAVEKAVIELDGVWPTEKTPPYVDAGYFLGVAGSLMKHDGNLENSRVICVYDEFMATRARLENKPSEWPDWALYLSQNENGKWCFHGAKPWRDHDGWCVDGSQAQIVASDGLVFGDWRQSLERRPDHIADANKMVEGEPEWVPRETLPPAGTECEYNQTNGGWVKVTVRYSGPDVVVVYSEFYGVEMPAPFASPADFRPLKTDRERAIEAAKRFFTGEGFCPNDQQLGKAYDKGLLKTPEGEQ